MTDANIETTSSSGAKGYLDKDRILGFDGVRAIAVLLVYAEHKTNLLHLGPLGVHLFFVLSGYLIVGILNRQRKSIENGDSSFLGELLKFWQKRARRIFPLYYIFLALVSTLLIVKGQSILDAGIYPWYLLISANIYLSDPAHDWTLFTHLWSLGVEQHFYILIAPLLLLTAKHLHAALLFGMLTVSLLATGIHFIAGADERQIYVSSITNFAFMATGGLIAITKLNFANRMAAFAAMVAAVVLAATQTKFGSTISAPQFRMVAYITGLLLSTVLIAHVKKNQGGVLTRLLEWRPLRALGTISYGFYVLHPYVPMPATGSTVLAVKLITQLAHLGLTVGVAYASWRLIEQPILKWRREGKGSAPPTF